MGRAGSVSLETAQFLAGFGLAIWLLGSYFARGGEAGAVLLLVYWALNLPALGQEVALIAWQYPAYRNVTLRLLEPLGALDQRAPAAANNAPLAAAVSIEFKHVNVVAAGHQILRDINLAIAPGTHVAIVGASGAGKSSFAGLLLGWHRAASGSVLVDGVELNESNLDGLRAHFAWVDPAVQIWNRPLAENLRYGSAETARIEDAIDAAELHRVIERLPNGLDTPLGEDGGLVSGGEGQRVRLARALLRPNVRLAILDEPFRGLDFEQRHALLARSREVWRGATLIFISHDIREALEFERVLVMEDGSVIEDGTTGRVSKPCFKPNARFATSSGTAPSGATCVYTMANSLPESCLWPPSRLGEALGLLQRPGPALTNPQSPIPDDLFRWIETAALTIGLEAQPAESPYSDFERQLPSMGPALIHLGPAFLAVLPDGRLLTTDLARVRVSPAAVRSALCATIEAPVLREIQTTLDRAEIAPAKQARARDAMLRERLNSKRIRGIWLLRLPPGASFWEQLRRAKIPRRLIALASAHALQYALWILAWFVVGSNVLRGGTDRGWLFPWALLLLTLVPLRVLITRLQGWVAIGAGALLKQRLFFGALRLDPDSLRHQGAGQLLGRVLESEAVEALALSGGFLALVALIEIVASLFRFGRRRGRPSPFGVARSLALIAAAIAWTTTSAAIAIGPASVWP